MSESLDSLSAFVAFHAASHRAYPVLSIMLLLHFMKGTQMPKKKTAHRSPWTQEDVRDLKAHSKARTPVSKVAKALKRTEGAIRQKALAIGLGIGHRR